MKAEACAGAHDMKEEDAVDDIDPGPSSSLRNGKRIAVSKIVKETALLWSMYDVGCRNLAEKQSIASERIWVEYGLRSGQPSVRRTKGSKA